MSCKAATSNALGDGNCTCFSGYFKPMLALFAGESRELAMFNGIRRASGLEKKAADRLKSATMLPLVMCSKMVIVLISMVLLRL